MRSSFVSFVQQWVSAAIVANLAAGRPPGHGDVDLAIGGAG